MCTDCVKLLSPYTTDRRKTSLAEIKDHLAYREANKQAVEAFQVTRTLGDWTKILLDENAGNFVVISKPKWREMNPDVIPFAQVTGCNTEIRESRREIRYTNSEGQSVSYEPPRYDIDYDFYVTIHVNSPYFNEIEFRVNSSSVEDRHSVQFREMDRMSQEIKEALTQVRQEARDQMAQANAPKMAQQCSYCGATTTPDDQGRCEYCGGALA